MKSALDDRLLECGSLLRRGYSAALSNSGKIIALIVALVSVLVTFTDVSLGGVLGRDTCTTLLLLLISSYVIYFSMEDAGERLGEESDEYREAHRRFAEAVRATTPDMSGALRSFCHRYTEEEARFRRASYLASEGYTAEELEAYQSGATFDKKATRVLRRASRMRQSLITPSMLLGSYGRARAFSLGSPATDKAVSGLVHLLPSSICMIFTVSVILTLKPALDAASVIDGILKLSALPVVAFKGYTAGYYHKRDSEASHLNAKARLLETFLLEQSVTT